MDPSDRRDEAFEFLAEIEAKHNQVLEELELLNARVQKVLDDYLSGRLPAVVSERNAAESTTASGNSSEAEAETEAEAASDDRKVA